MAVTYTYDDFVKAANSAGLYNQFSNADLQMAQQDPNFGMSILGLKQEFAGAATDEQKQQINARANALRSSYGNYTGGTDGSKYISTGLLNNETDELRNAVSNYGAFSYDVAAPTYNNQYAAQQQALLNEILNRKEFEWSKENDPQWAPLKKEYLREGDRATANALAQASAASGGRASSYAVNAATQAGDYYATQLTDMIPTLYQQAYERYLAEQQLKYSDLNAVNSQEQLDYSKYLNDLSQWNTDRNFAYTDYQTQYNMLQQAYENAVSQQQTEFNQNLTMQQYQDQIAQVQQEQKAAQIDAILSAGGTPSAELLNGSGYSNEYIQAIAAEYAKQRAQTEDAAARELADWYAKYGDYSQAAGYGVNTSAMLAAASGSGSSGGNVSTPGGDDQEGDIYSWLLASGATDYGTAYAALLNAGYSSTAAKELANYFNDTYYPNKETGDPSNEAPASSGEKYGVSWNTVWPRARTMYDQGKSAEEIMDYLDARYEAGQLTKAGVEYIMNSLNLSGYRTGD